VLVEAGPGSEPEFVVVFGQSPEGAPETGERNKCV